MVITSEIIFFFFAILHHAGILKNKNNKTNHTFAGDSQQPITPFSPSSCFSIFHFWDEIWFGSCDIFDRAPVWGGRLKSLFSITLPPGIRKGLFIYCSNSGGLGGIPPIYLRVKKDATAFLPPFKYFFIVSPVATWCTLHYHLGLLKEIIALLVFELKICGWRHSTH